MVTGLQSQGKLLQGLRDVIALRLGHPFARFIVAVAQFLFLLQPTANGFFSCRRPWQSAWPYPCPVAAPSGPIV